jgi:hypothetical protein
MVFSSFFISGGGPPYLTPGKGIPLLWSGNRIAKRNGTVKRFQESVTKR